jgi:hypothetical protein
MFNFILGLIIMAIGFVIVFKSEAMLSNFGRIAFFEKYLGTEGGSRLGYKIIGLTAVFFGTLIATNLIGGFLNWALSPMLKYMVRNPDIQSY